MDFLDLVKEKIKEVPIGAWVPYYDKDLNLDYLKDIKNVGINYIPARDSKKETLDLIKESGLYAIVNDDRVVYSNIHTLNEIHNYLDDYIDHDAYFMSFIWDEPSPTMMYFSSAILKQVEKAKEKAIGYVNLHPNYSDVITQREGLSYDEYIEHFIKLHNPKVLSFDNYPFSMLAQPTLTAIEVDMYEMGNQAARFIVQRIKKPNLQTQSFCTTPILIEREST